MKKIAGILVFAFVFSFCCACNAVTPGPSTTRSSAAAIAVLPQTEEETSAKETTVAAVTQMAETTLAVETAEEELPAGTSMKASIEVNVRSGPGTDTNVVGELEEGQVVEVLGEEEGWAAILYQGEKCYVASRYLEAIE